MLFLIFFWKMQGEGKIRVTQCFFLILTELLIDIFYFYRNFARF